MSADRGPGTVYLVGGGPGDPGLLTIRAQALLAAAGAVVADAGLEALLSAAGAADAELVLVGDDAGQLRAPAGVVAQLRELAERHERVVRLVADDPFVYGRAAEEALLLAGAGVKLEVVPGVSAATAVAACAGIPVLHPVLAPWASVAGAGALLRGEVPPPPAAGAAGGTLVVRLGAGEAPGVLERLLAAGYPAAIPAALIAAGASPHQQTAMGTLGELARPGAAPQDAALLVLGEVVRLRERLAWYERRPLFGRRVVVTRAREQAAGFVAELEAMGAEVVHFATIQITDPPDPEPLRQAARTAHEYDWVILTSVNGVDRFWAALHAAGRDTRALGGVRICAIGPATAAAIELHGARPDLVPGRFVAEEVIAALADTTRLHGARILLPRAEVARSIIPDSLRALGAEVAEVPAYRTVTDAHAGARLKERLRAGEIDLLTFTSSSTVRNFVEAAGAEIGAARVASIGPITSQTARELGLEVHVEASDYTVPGLLRAIRAAFGGAAA